MSKVENNDRTYGMSIRFGGSFSISSQLAPINQRIQNIIQRGIAPYVHCSKISSLINAIRQIPEMLIPLMVSSDSVFPKRSVKHAIKEILNELDLIDQFLTDFSQENCLSAVATQPVGLMKRRVAEIRQTLQKSFKALGIEQIAKLFEITSQKLDSQDEVDLNRIGQVLLIAKTNHSIYKDILNQRFSSLGRENIEVNSEITDAVSVPGLPDYTIKHEDVQLGKLIGRGQYGEVRLGNVISTNQEAAVKIIRLRALQGPALESFKREVFVQATVKHPCILPFYGYTDESPFYILTQFMQHGNLFDQLKKDPDALTPTKRSIIAYDVANGLAYLHSKGIIHRDLKSLNVLLDENYRAKICDFGMVSLCRGQKVRTGGIGTFQWMAPEVFNSEPDYNEKIDVYSYGIFLWELLTSKAPYEGENEMRVPFLVAQMGYRPSIPPDAPAGVAKLIQKCWDQDPAKRPSMRSVMRRLTRNKFHFPGTEEHMFLLATGLAKHHHRHHSLRLSKSCSSTFLLSGSSQDSES